MPKQGKMFAGITRQIVISDETHHLAEQYISDILIALNHATPEQAFLLRAHIGNYSLFIS